MTSRRVAVFGGGKRSRIILKTRSYEGRVKTAITIPLCPAAISKWSSEAWMWASSAR